MTLRPSRSGRSGSETRAVIAHMPRRGDAMGWTVCGISAGGGDEWGYSRERPKKYLARAVGHWRNLRASQSDMQPLRAGCFRR